MPNIVADAELPEKLGTGSSRFTDASNIKKNAMGGDLGDCGWPDSRLKRMRRKGKGGVAGVHACG